MKRKEEKITLELGFITLLRKDDLLEEKTV